MFCFHKDCLVNC